MSSRAPTSIQIVTPAPPRSRTGNRVTALRWARRLRELGHRVRLAQRFEEGPLDLLVALHAVKSAAAVESCHARRPEVARVVALSGTDVYGGLREPAGQRSLALATRIVALQPLAALALPSELRAKVRVIRQSAPPA